MIGIWHIFVSALAIANQPLNVRINPIPDSLSAHFDRLEHSIPAFDTLLAQCRLRHIPVDYEQVAYATMQRFLTYGRSDLVSGDRIHADSIAIALDTIQQSATARLQSYLNGSRRAAAAPRYVTQHVRINDASLQGDVRWPDGHLEHDRPLFLIGYGHFGQVRRDLPVFHDFGTNAIQIELGPQGVVFPSTSPGRLFDDSVSTITGDIQHVLDTAAKYHVAVNLLLSPHYFPPWALERWPAVKDTSGDGFIQFNIVAPEAKAIIESYLRTVIPLIKDAPALNSVTLSNEPRYDAKGDSADLRTWHQYVQQLYGTIAKCNVVLQSQYTTFSDIPIPTRSLTPLFYDWMTFREARFAAWHAWMAGIVHDIAPQLPVHVKLLSWTMNDLTASIDPERFASFSDMSGNDNWISSGGELAYERFYDFLGSLKSMPIFDSEAHLLPGTAAQVRTGLWQGALHGRNAATL